MIQGEFQTEMDTNLWKMRSIHPSGHHSSWAKKVNWRTDSVQQFKESREGPRLSHSQSKYDNYIPLISPRNSQGGAWQEEAGLKEHPFSGQGTSTGTNIVFFLAGSIIVGGMLGLLVLFLVSACIKRPSNTRIHPAQTGEGTERETGELGEQQLQIEEGAPDTLQSSRMKRLKQLPSFQIIMPGHRVPSFLAWPATPQGNAAGSPRRRYLTSHSVSPTITPLPSVGRSVIGLSRGLDLSRLGVHPPTPGRGAASTPGTQISPHGRMD